MLSVALAGVGWCALRPLAGSSTGGLWCNVGVTASQSRGADNCHIQFELKHSFKQLVSALERWVNLSIAFLGVVSYKSMRSVFFTLGAISPFDAFPH